MPTSLISTGVQFPDSSIQTTAVGAPGSWVYISTTTASNSATVDITSGFSSTYDTYVIVFQNLATTLDDRAITTRLYLGGSLVTSVNYKIRSVLSGSSGFSSPTAAAGNAFYFDFDGSTASYGQASGQYTVYNANASSNAKAVSLSAAASSQGRLTLAAGALEASGVVTGIRFFASEGNINTGTFILYGIKKS